MVTDADRRLAEFLARVVGELRALQEEGRFQDSASRAEVEFLEREMRAAQARAGGAVEKAARPQGGERIPGQEP